MALLDVSEALHDPLFNSSFDVLRRIEEVNVLGRSETIPKTFKDKEGTIVPASNEDLDRLDDAQRQNRAISILTTFRLQGPTTDKQADIIIWQGDQYVVATVDLFTHYGDGFTQVIAVLLPGVPK